MSLGAVSGLKQWTVATTGTWAGNLLIQAFANGVWTTIATLTSTSGSPTNFNTNGSIPYDYPVFLRILAALTGGTAGTTLSTLAYSYSFDMQVLLVNSPTQALGYVPDIPLLSINEFITSDWQEGAWSLVQGWPSVVTFYQDRMIWGGLISIWMSQTGDYVNFGVSDPLVDSDAINVNVPTRKLNNLAHLLPMYVVLGLTSSGEISVGPGGSGDLSPTSIDLRPQTYHGAADVTPVLIGNEAIFVQARSSMVRNISYQYFTNIFTGQIVNLVSTHLFQNFTLLDMTYAESPNSLTFAVRSDGVLLCFTYLPEQQMMAWTHWDTLGQFESCAVIPAVTFDELWVVVNRTNGRFIERLAQRLPTLDTKDQFHVDCGIDYNGAPTTSISGLDYLDGQSVMCLADGNVQGPFTVVAGSITLTTAASLVHIGLPYTSDMETLNVEAPGQNGIGQALRQRIAQVTIRFSNSLGGYIGPTSDKLHPIIPTPPPSLDSYRPLFTGDVPKISIYPNWQSNGRIFFRQTDPLPFTITGVFPFMENGNI